MTPMLKEMFLYSQSMVFREEMDLVAMYVVIKSNFVR